MNNKLTTKNTKGAKGAKNKAYPKYKPSGVEWLGEVPEHWDVVSLRHLFDIKAGGDLKEEFYSEEKTEKHPYPIYTNSIKSSEAYGFSSKPFFKSNTITVTGRGEIGYAYYRDHEYDAIIRLLVLTPKKKAPCKYYSYFINSMLNFFGGSTAVSQLSTEQISPYKVFTPPLPEQQAIAAFLDHETGRMDALVTKKQRLLELLAEQRTALISRAVTRGLFDLVQPDDPDFGQWSPLHSSAFIPHPSYKPSGVEWLGEVPEHWGVKRAGLAYSIQLGKMLQPDTSASEDEQYKYLKALHVQWENIRVDDLPEMWASKTELGKYSVKKGDLLVCEGGEVGRAGILKDDLHNVIIQNSLHRVRSKNNLNSYLMYVLKNAASKNWFDILCNKATIAHFTGDKFSALRIPLPPLPEQQANAAFLDRETAKIDTLSVKVTTAIERLKEYRTALISSAVTGKIDVREAV